MQCAIDLLGQLARDALHAGEIVDAGIDDAAHAAEALQQAGALARPDARDLLEPARLALLLAAGSSRPLSNVPAN